MNSEFSKVPLDRIRYSLVWEDSSTLYDALNINSHDRVLMITSAGCNVLNVLLKNPAAVYAIDLNLLQNQLLLLKKHIILNHDYWVFHALLGLGEPSIVQPAIKKLFSTLPKTAQRYWKSFFEKHPAGLLSSGQLESYITRFFHTLSEDEQEKVTKLISFTNINEQAAFFMSNLDNSSFQQQFINYFDDENLSKGRDPKLLKYAIESGGVAFYNRLKQQVQSVILSQNFYFRFFFFGPASVCEEILPPCYRESNYQCLKDQLGKLNIITGEAIDFLLSPAGAEINKASLSNIFEYTSREEFMNVCESLAKNAKSELSIVFWNLLNGQGETLDSNQKNITLKKVSPSSQACFYFRNTLSISIQPVKPI